MTTIDYNRETKMRVIWLLSLLFLLSCGSDTISNPKYVVGRVDSTNHVHWGKGLYKLKVHYTFQVPDSMVSNVYVHKLEKAYTARYETGDSVLVEYDGGNPNTSRIVKIAKKGRTIRL